MVGEIAKVVRFRRAYHNLNSVRSDCYPNIVLFRDLKVNHSIANIVIIHVICVILSL